MGSGGQRPPVHAPRSHGSCLSFTADPLSSVGASFGFLEEAAADDGRLSSCGFDGLGLDGDLAAHAPRGPPMTTPNLGPIQLPHSPDDLEAVHVTQPILTPNGKLASDQQAHSASPSRHAHLPPGQAGCGCVTWQQLTRAHALPSTSSPDQCRPLGLGSSLAAASLATSCPINLSVVEHGLHRPSGVPGVLPPSDSASSFLYEFQATSNRMLPAASSSPLASVAPALSRLGASLGLAGDGRGIGGVAAPLQADFNRPCSSSSSSSSFSEGLASATATPMHGAAASGQADALPFASALAAIGPSATCANPESVVSPPMRPAFTSAWDRSISGGLGGVGGIGGAMACACVAAPTAHSLSQLRPAPSANKMAATPLVWAGLDAPAVSWVDEWLREVNR